MLRSLFVLPVVTEGNLAQMCDFFDKALDFSHRLL